MNIVAGLVPAFWEKRARRIAHFRTVGGSSEHLTARLPRATTWDVTKNNHHDSHQFHAGMTEGGCSRLAEENNAQK